MLALEFAANWCGLIRTVYQAPDPKVDPTLYAVLVCFADGVLERRAELDALAARSGSVAEIAEYRPLRRDDQQMEIVAASAHAAAALTLRWIAGLVAGDLALASIMDLDRAKRWVLDHAESIRYRMSELEFDEREIFRMGARIERERAAMDAALPKPVASKSSQPTPAQIEEVRRAVLRLGRSAKRNQIAQAVPIRRETVLRILRDLKRGDEYDG